MTFFKNFIAQNNFQAILYLMATEIFGFRQKLCLWRPFKEGTPHLVTYFGELFSCKDAAQHLHFHSVCQSVRLSQN